MDNDVAIEKQHLEDALRVTELFFQSPSGAAYIDGLKENEEALTNRIIFDEVTSIPQVFAHFAAIGHLRGVREVRQQLLAMPETLKAELKAL